VKAKQVGQYMEIWSGTVLITAFVMGGNLMILGRAPPYNPALVTAGAAELFSIELGVENKE
jgi:hypothetical protein